MLLSPVIVLLATVICVAGIGDSVLLLPVPRADHDDQDVVMFNRCMLPSYYGLLRLACHHAPRTFARQLSRHQNVLWAFKNIAPYPSQYHAVRSDLPAGAPFQHAGCLCFLHCHYIIYLMKFLGGRSKSEIAVYI